MNYDFRGYATRFNVQCSDGRIIMRDAFRDDDGKTVPLVWNHQHNNVENVLGHAVLENTDDGVVAYAVFNDTPAGRSAKELVRHGDISALSIYANKLKETAGRVVHGVIREVSLVLAGANPKATIDSFVAHSDGSCSEDRTQGWFYSGMDGELYHSDAEDPKDDEEEKEEKPDSGADETKDPEEDRQEDETEDADDKDESGEDDEDSAEEDEEEDDSDDDDDDETEEDDGIEHADKADVDEDGDDDETVGDILDTFTDKQKVIVMAMLENIMSQKGEEETEMKHNLFDPETQNEENVLSHSDEVKIIEMAKSSNVGTLKAAMKAFCEDESLSHGFDSQSLTLLFPEYKDVKPGAPEMLTTDQGWITKVLNKVHKSPISRIRTRFADIRELEKVKADNSVNSLRAKGYTKGAQKALSGDISMLYRTTDPQTVYVRSDLDRDDIIDITDFDIVAYLYNVDRMALNEELATAIMLGDGRAVGTQGKIDETKIRNIWKDDELYTIHRMVDFTQPLQGTATGTNFGENFMYAETFVQELLYGREDAKNVGMGDLFIAPHVLNKMLLARDRNGRRIYNTVEELRSALNVREIITAEQFEGKTRTTSVTETVEGTETTVTKTLGLMAILVNLDNYHLGATKGGEITHFTDFDINFNKEQSLLETRTSGANVRPLSALVLETEVTD